MLRSNKTPKPQPQPENMNISDLKTTGKLTELRRWYRLNPFPEKSPGYTGVVNAGDNMSSPMEQIASLVAKGVYAGKILVMVQTDTEEVGTPEWSLPQINLELKPVEVVIEKDESPNQPA